MRTSLLLALLTAAIRTASAAPELDRDIVETAIAAKSFKTLIAALQAADLVEAVKAKGPFTVFAPTDAAFAKLPRGTLAELLKPQNKERLQQILAFHVVPKRLGSVDMVGTRSSKSLGGAELSIGFADGRLSIEGASFVKTDIRCSNGVIHVIDAVMLPPDPAAQRRSAVRATLELAIDRGVPLFNAGQAEACASIYELTVRAVTQLASGELSREESVALDTALAQLKRTSGARERAWLLRRAIDKTLRSLAAAPEAAEEKPKSTAKRSTFKPLLEASLPAGFPGPGPDGEVVLKAYPKYRAARAAGGNSFWKLFSHIKKNKIAMTAPVETTVTEQDGRLKTSDMAFLYATPALGRAGRDGNVEVLDLEPIRVLSYGIRGPMTSAKTRQAKQAIEAQLSRQGLKRNGEWRLLGYNSPMVPAERRFWELQLPVTPATDETLQ